MSTFIRRLFALTLAFSLLFSVANAQSLKLGVEGGLAFLVATKDNYGLRDHFTRPVTEGGYGFGPRAHFLGAAAKYTLPHSPITLAAHFAYFRLKGSGEFNWVSATGTEQAGKDYEADLYTVSVGGQWHFGQGGVRPYIGAHLLWSAMPEVRERKWGPITEIAVYYQRSFYHLGGGFAAGAELDLVSHLSLDLAVRYNFTSPLHGEDPALYRTYFNTCIVGIGVLYEILP